MKKTDLSDLEGHCSLKVDKKDIQVAEGKRDRNLNLKLTRYCVSLEKESP